MHDQSSEDSQLTVEATVVSDESSVGGMISQGEFQRGVSIHQDTQRLAARRFLEQEDFVDEAEIVAMAIVHGRE